MGGCVSQAKVQDINTPVQGTIHEQKKKVTKREKRSSAEFQLVDSVYSVHNSERTCVSSTFSSLDAERCSPISSTNRRSNEPSFNMHMLDGGSGKPLLRRRASDNGRLYSSGKGSSRLDHFRSGSGSLHKRVHSGPMEIWCPPDQSQALNMEHERYGGLSREEFLEEKDRSTLTFAQVTQEQDAQEAFRSYNSKQYTEENMLFYQAATKWTQEAAACNGALSEEMRVRAKQIYTGFICTGAEQEVNISGSVRRQLASVFEAPQLILTGREFDRSLEEVARLIKTHSLPRFLMSETYEEYLINQIRRRRSPSPF